LETAYLAAVAFHPRFQRLVDIEKRRLASGDAEEGRQELIRKLDPDSRRRLAVLEEKRTRILEMARESQAGDYTIETGRDALDRLLWIYLKLLVARRHLQASRAQAGEADLKRKIADLERELKAGGAPSALRESQTATLKILRQRLENLERCEQGLTQVETDLSRIEAQVDLAQESATVRGGGAALTANLELASQILDDGLEFGDSQAAVVALDEAYGAPPTPPRTRERA
jgi:hypothetical protein